MLWKSRSVFVLGSIRGRPLMGAHHLLHDGRMLIHLVHKGLPHVYVDL